MKVTKLHIYNSLSLLIYVPVTKPVLGLDFQMYFQFSTIILLNSLITLLISRMMKNVYFQIIKLFPSSD